jgi:thiosulfate/3-mercaptopyruvate sulfurtransferase
MVSKRRPLLYLAYGFVALLVLVLGLLVPGAPVWASSHWTDIADEEWESTYGVSPEAVATIAWGFEDGTFQPVRLVTRGQFAKMVAIGFGVDEVKPEEPTFSDVPADDPLYAWIESASAAKLVSGYGDGTFQPSLPISREQAASILASALAVAELTAGERIDGGSGEYGSIEEWYAAEGVEVLDAFSDGTEVASVHVPATAYLVSRGIMRGHTLLGGTLLSPRGELTRAQAVVLILRTIAKLAGEERTIDAFVSTNWLADNIGKDDLVILDLRSASEYEGGHIPGSISVPFGANSAWAGSDELTFELPPDEDLLKTVGDCGIGKDSSVVLVGGVAQGAPTYPLVDTARVAVTLAYVGVGNVAILQGGYSRWAAEGKATTVDVPDVKPASFTSLVRSDVVVSTTYVKDHIGTAVIVDTRSAEVYFGVAVDVSGERGHIPTARCLPTQWAWQGDGTYVSPDLAEQLAVGVLGADKHQEIIVYCTTGATASAWWFVLSQLLGYRNVKLYDGSAQAWAKDNDMVAFAWSS